MSALPQEVKHLLRNPVHEDAYNLCRQFETIANGDDQKLRHARVLGYMVLYAPSDAARSALCREISSCRAHDDSFDRLSCLGRLFIDHYIRAFRKYKGRTPKGSTHPSRPSFDLLKEKISAGIQEAPKTHKEAKDLALIRDGFQCVVTHAREITAAFTQEQMKQHGYPVYTECAHIVPESTYFESVTVTEHIPFQREYAASVLAVLTRFGYDVEKLNGEKVHSLNNVITMEHNQHDFFDCLEMYFEATEVENCYRVKYTFADFMERNVTLTSTDSQLPLPSPQLLALHAACVKVAHLSGAGEYLDKLDRDEDELTTLSPTGESADVLVHALSGLMSRSLLAG